MFLVNAIFKTFEQKFDLFLPLWYNENKFFADYTEYIIMEG